MSVLTQTSSWHANGSPLLQLAPTRRREFPTHAFVRRHLYFNRVKIACSFRSHLKGSDRIWVNSLNWSVFPFLNRWKLNGTEISSKYGSHYILSGGNLRISRLNKDQDAGTYQCLASNSFGTIVSREASLTFACKSLFPTTLQASFSSFCVVEEKRQAMKTHMLVSQF